MKSIQTKIILLVLLGIIVSGVIIGGAGIISFEKVIDNDTVEIINLTCSKKAQELNNVLGRIEQSVEILSVYAVDNLESREKMKNDTEYLEKYTRELGELGLTVANETDGAVTVYVRFNPEITSSTAGFFKVENIETGIFEDFETTDLAKYSPDDIEHVGWYYLPIQEGKPVWMQPYYNENIDVYMISYVIPIYKDEGLIGIVGMDIDFNFIAEKTDSIKIYDTGEAFLTDGNFKIVHSKSYEKDTLVSELDESLDIEENDNITSIDSLYEYTINGVKKKVAFRRLENDMCLAVTAPVSEIDSNKDNLIMQIIVMVCFIIIVFIIIALEIAKTIVRPLKELNIAAKEIADGNLDVSLACKSRDEVGTLSESLRETAKQLKIRIEYINNLAYVDKLTGIKNNTAYLHDVSLIKEEILEGQGDFSLFVIDINGLKVINDNYGHYYGNRLIITASKVIAEVFGYENAYRIGGDEFAVIMKNADSLKCSRLEKEFEITMEKEIGEIRLSAAIGSAIYNKSVDDSYESVFKRADGEMYKEKMEMKAKGETSTIEIFL